MISSHRIVKGRNLKSYTEPLLVIPDNYILIFRIKIITRNRVFTIHGGYSHAGRFCVCLSVCGHDNSIQIQLIAFKSCTHRTIQLDEHAYLIPAISVKN